MVKVTHLSARRAQIPEIHKALRQGVEDGVFPGGAAAVFLEGKLVHLSSSGEAQRVPSSLPIADDALFDLASLTKVLATTPAIVRLVTGKQLGLDDAVVRYLPAFGRNGKKAVTVRQLLAHSSGLRAWRPFFLDVMKDPTAKALFQKEPPDRGLLLAAVRRGTNLVREAIENESLERAPGESAVYSDLGFLTLGFLIEAVAGEPLDRFVEREIFSELRLPTLHFRPLAGPRTAGPPIVATGVVRPREPAPGQEEIVPSPPADAVPDPRPGEVDDDNAFAMGGVAGHAGVFGSARDVAEFGARVIEELEGAHRLSSPEIWTPFTQREGTKGGTRALGFDTPSEEGSSAGRFIAASKAVGHTGFTGTSLWIDLERKLSVALLTNRTHPTRTNRSIVEFRPRFHDAVVEALDLSGAPSVETGAPSEKP